MALVQSIACSNPTAGTTPATSASVNVTAGNYIYMAVGMDGGITGLVTGITDSNSRITWTRVPSFDYANTGGTLSLDAWYGKVNSTGPTVINVAFQDANTNCNWIAQERNEALAVSPLDQATKAQGSSTAPASGSTGTTAQASELIMGLAVHASTVSAFSAGSGYSDLAQSSVAARQTAIEFKTVAATGAQSAAFKIAASRAWLCGVITFKIATASTQALTLPFISSTTLLFGMLIQMIVALPFIDDSTDNLYPPSLALGPATLGLPFIPSTTQLFPETVQPGPVALTMPFINDADTLFGFSMRFVSNVTLPFISSGASISPPALAPGPVTLSLPHINSEVIYPPALAVGGIAMVLPFIPSSSTPNAMAIRRKMNPSELPLLGMG